MTEDNVKMDITTASDEVTDAPLGSADTTVGHDDDTGSILHKILEALAGDKGSKGEAESLRKWIDDSKGPKQDLEMRDDHGRTPLHVAATNGLLEAAGKLIDAKADLNAQDQDGETPLFAACYAGQEKIAVKLLEADADTTLADEYNQTPLYAAAHSGSTTIVQSLLDKSKQTLDLQSGSYRWTPLHKAIVNGNEATVRYLQDNGAKLDIQDRDGWTPLMTAIVFQNEDALKVLLEERKGEDKFLDIEDDEGRTPLFRAAEDCFWEGARLLAMAGARCDKSEDSKDSKPTDADSTLVVTPRQDTALHLAVSANQLILVRILLEKDANVNALNYAGQHSSHLASSKGYKVILELVLDAQDSKGLNARDDNGMTPLHLACNADEPNDDEQETSDTTANGLTENIASIPKLGRFDEVVRLLLQRHADTTAVTNDNKTALELAFYSRYSIGWEAILQYLPQNSEEFSHALLRAASDTKRHQIVKSLFEIQLKQSGTSLPTGSESWTAIEWAAYIANPDALLLLIASSPQNKATGNAIKKAKELVQSGDQPANPAAKPGDEKRGEADEMKKSDNRKKPNKNADKVKSIRDYLDDPLIGLICSDSQKYGTPVLKEQSSSILDEYKVSIVQFHKQEGRFGKIKRSRTVKETIYTEGPKKIMDDVASMLERLAKVEVEQGSPTANFMGTKSQFTWIHLPATNMAWMDDLLQRIMKDEDKSASEFNQAKSFFKDSWIQVPDKVSSSRIMRPQCVWRDTKGNGTSNENPSKKGFVELSQSDSRDTEGTTAASALVSTAIYIPYFSYSFHCSDEYPNVNEAGNAKKLPKSSKKHNAQPKEPKEPMLERLPAPEPNAVKLDGKEAFFADKLSEKRKRYKELIQACKDNIIHGSSTLDESYYHFADDARDEKSREDRMRRNRTQVVTDIWHESVQESWHDSRRRSRPEIQGVHPYWPLIRVNQLWIWTIDDKWLISASSHPIDDHENELLKGILELLNKQGEAGGSGLQPSSASEMSQLIVDYCVESYERKPRGIKGERPDYCKLDKLLSIRQAFSKSINSIARGETDLFGTFSKLTKELRTVSSLKEPSKDGDGRSLDKRLADATDQAEDLAKAVKDIIDELNMIEATAHYQQDVQRSMKAMKAMKKQELQSIMKEMKKDKIPETDLTATYVINDIQRLDSVAKRVHDAVNTTLSLQQSEVANLQARLSLEQADASARQGRVVMVFTVVTIVFLPLSFLTSFFALDVSSFQPQAWAVGIIFSVSIAFSIPTVILAFTWKQSKKFMSKQLDWILNKKPTGNGGPIPDPGVPEASSLGVNQNRTRLTGPHQIGNREQSTSKGTELDLEKGHGMNDGSS